MTLHVCEETLQIQEDFLAIAEGNTYHFNGVSWGQNRYTPNSFWASLCYALGPNEFLVINPEEAFILEGGQKTLTVADNFRDVLHSSTRSCRVNESIIKTGDPDGQDVLLWPKSWYSLFGPSHRCPAIESILSRVKSHVKHSLNTIDAAAKTLRVFNQRPPFMGAAKIYIAGKQWLWFDSANGFVALGHGLSLWGKRKWPAKETIPTTVAPVPSGWFVKVGSSKCFLLHVNDNKVEVSNILFPTGKWRSSGSWVFWNDMILTPNKQMVLYSPITEQLEADRWAIASPSLPWQCRLVSPWGEVYTTDLPPIYMYYHGFFVGDSRMLVIHRGAASSGANLCLSVAAIKNPPSIEHLQVIASSPYLPADRVFVLPELPDLFLLAFQTRCPKGLGLCLLDARGAEWHLPTPLELKDSRWFPNLSVETKGNQIFVRWSGDKTNQSSPQTVILTVREKQVHMIKDGVEISGEMSPLPLQENALSKRLRPVFECDKGERQLCP